MQNSRVSSDNYLEISYAVVFEQHHLDCFKYSYCLVPGLFVVISLRPVLEIEVPYAIEELYKEDLHV